MGQPKSKRTAMLDPRHRAKLLKEKYRQQFAGASGTGIRQRRNAGCR